MNELYMMVTIVDRRFIRKFTNLGTQNGIKYKQRNKRNDNKTAA